MRIKYLLILVSNTLVIITAITLSAFLYKTHKSALLEGIDNKLLTAARFAEDILPEKYHDNIVDEHSVSKDEFEKYVQRNNKLCLNLNLQYIWSVMVVDNQIVFTSATSPGKDVKKGDHASFFEVHTNPDAFKEAFNTMKVKYSSFHNKWGHGRMVLVPAYDSKGRPYCFGSSMSIDDVNSMVGKTITNSLIISVIVLFVGLILSFILSSFLSKPIIRLTEIAEDIASGNLNQKIEMRGSLELRNLSKSIDTMAKSMNDKIEEVENQNTALTKEIMERKQIKKALDEQLKFLQTLIDTIPNPIFFKDVDGIYRGCNKAFEDFSGLPTEEVVGKTVYDIWPKELADIYYEADNSLFKNPEVQIYETYLQYADGSYHDVIFNKATYTDANGNLSGLVGVVVDITQRKQAEEALRESEEKLARSKKMEALGLLAGGGAHDLNNVLSGIVSYPELLLLDLPDDSKLRNPIEPMQESGHRAAAIVQDLLTVARGVATIKEPLNLNDLVSDYLNSPEFKKLKKFHPTVTIKANLDSNLLNIVGSHVHIRKVVMNLVSNASEAIDGSGNIAISTVNLYVDTPLKGYDDITIGEYAVLVVSDDGSGISSGDLERIFEPFYTKKVMDRSGTGLGLAVVWNVVRDHEGYIDVKSDENGTKFELYFPITRDEISVDLILLDMIMSPGINGRETYERIIEIHPKQKAIIFSGFAESDEVKETQKIGAGKYIKKPLILEKIGLAVRDELKK
jgi:PAS domain S-box-containing protein